MPELRPLPVYGYEIQKWLEISHTELWADVLPGSIYHALRQMEKEGLLQEVHPAVLEAVA